jgi:catechol 2,3-dioxygenase-like lactoylglutathione lyase family enzyme
MAVRFQLVIDCADPELLARFWAEALGYELEPPPAGFATWDDYRRDLGIPELGIAADCIRDPAGEGPRFWFQTVPEGKTIKNRIHIDVHAGGDRTVPLATRKERVDTEARRLTALGATLVEPLREKLEDDGVDHYAVALRDPEGNEFDIN